MRITNRDQITIGKRIFIIEDWNGDFSYSRGKVCKIEKSYFKIKREKSQYYKTIGFANDKIFHPIYKNEFPIFIYDVEGQAIKKIKEILGL